MNRRSSGIFSLFISMIIIMILLILVSGLFIYFLPIIIVVVLIIFVYRIIKGVINANRSQSTQQSNNTSQTNRQTTTINKSDSIDVEYTVINEDTQEENE